MAEDYSEITRGIRVSVKPEYSPDHSNLEVGVFVYLYTITLQNDSPDTVQLISRHWIIADGLGQEEQIIGDGVVGQKPVLAPGTSFTYTSSCPLKTPSGSMRGRYQVRNSVGETFDIAIPEFFLRDNRLLN